MVAAVLFVLWATSCTKNCGIVVQPAGAESAITLMVVTFSGVLLVHCENTTFALLLVAPRYPVQLMRGFFVMFPSPLIFSEGSARAAPPVSVSHCYLMGT